MKRNRKTQRRREDRKQKSEGKVNFPGREERKEEYQTEKEMISLRPKSTLKIKILFFYLSRQEVTRALDYMKEIRGRSLFSSLTI